MDKASGPLIDIIEPAAPANAPGADGEWAVWAVAALLLGLLAWVAYRFIATRGKRRLLRRFERISQLADQERGANMDWPRELTRLLHDAFGVADVHPDQPPAVFSGQERDAWAQCARELRLQYSADGAKRIDRPFVFRHVARWLERYPPC